MNWVRRLTRPRRARHGCLAIAGSRVRGSAGWLSLLFAGSRPRRGRKTAITAAREGRGAAWRAAPPISGSCCEAGVACTLPGGGEARGGEGRGGKQRPPLSGVPRCRGSAGVVPFAGRQDGRQGPRSHAAPTPGRRPRLPIAIGEMGGRRRADAARSGLEVPRGAVCPPKAPQALMAPKVTDTHACGVRRRNRYASKVSDGSARQRGGA